MQQAGTGREQGTGGLRGADVAAPSLGPAAAATDAGMESARSAGAGHDGAIPADEREALRTRRRLARVEDDAATPTVGLALSGGGIRSATFCLGLLRGMARRGLLSRFDYLSTVSGGGYTGAMFGRLVGRVGIAEAERILAASDSRPLAWLRRYGRYLAPRGAKDYGMGLATYLRAMVAVHLEFAFLALTLGLVAVLPHALHRTVGLFDVVAWSGWPSAWWPLAAGLWLATAPGLLGVYWMLRDPATAPDASAGSAPSMSAQPATGRRLRFRRWDLLVVLAAAGAGGVLLLRWAAMAVHPESGEWWLPGPGWGPLFGLVLASLGMSGMAVATALRAAPRSEAPRATVARLRRRMTGALRMANMAFAALLLLGLLDWASWTLLDLLGSAPGRLYGGLGLGGLALLSLRALLEPAQKWLGGLGGGGGGGGGGTVLPTLAGALGYALAFLLVVLWTTLMQWCVFSPGFESALATALGIKPAPALAPDAALAMADGAGLAQAVAGLLASIAEDALWRWAACAAALAVWFVGTGTNAASANTTSLHNMYAARLVRAYLGAVNDRRVGDGAAAGLSASAEGTSPETLSDVTEVHADDDLPLDRYDPSTNGGPIHLMNVCLNQTRGHRSGLYNADRKGVPLVVGAHGLRIGPARVPVDGSGRLGTLGRWVAISGAVASPGAGAYTTPGWASLLFLAGARLGYWLDMREAAHAPDASRPRRLSAEWWRDHWQATKMGRMASEFRAVYGGPLARNWYLSDGGHFDNTGVHALLERELDLIVLADCGADPRYELADLENLVRKARIDFGADIEFYTGEDANALHRRLCAASDDADCTDAGRTADDEDTARAIAFLSPESLADNTTTRGLLLARILYRADREGRRREGRLVVVKPNLHAALDMDLLAYARRNPHFPQQATGDQFFDEAQWESYHRLGEDTGAQLRRDWLLPLAGRSRLSDPPRIRASRLQKDAPAATGAFWRLDAKRAAVGALSLGALIAVLAPAWQVLDRVRAEREQQRKDLMAVVRDADRLYGGLSAAQEAARADADGAYVVSRLVALSARFPKDGVEGGTAWRVRERLAQLCAEPRGTLSEARWRERSEICGQLEPQKTAYARLLDGYWLRDADDAPGADRAAQAKQAIATTTGAASARLAMQEVRRQTDALRTGQASAADAFARGGAEPLAGDTKGVRMPPVAPPLAPAILPAILPPSDPDAAKRNAPPAPGSVEAVHVACSGNGGVRQRLYVHVHDAAGSAAMLDLPWSDTGLFTGAPDIENVSVSAAARGERPPRPHPQPTLLLHDPARSVDCAEALGLWLARPRRADAPAQPIRIRPLPKGYRGRPGVIELWWPPADAPAAARDRATAG